MSAQKAKNTIGKVRQLQRKLYLAAKGNSKRKFHALYDKIYREDILMEAWKRVRANGGAAGIDGVSIEAVEAAGVENLVEEIRKELLQGCYRPQPVKRVYIPKVDGGQRPLGIPVIKDRIVQSAAKIVIEPVFEADFKECSYGYRPKRNMGEALEAVRKACNNKGWWVVDADITAFFDTINHEKLMKLVALRITDRRVLKLLRQWLTAGIMAEGNYEDSEIGSPQGGVISALMANIYLNLLDTIWEKHGTHLGKFIRYADDSVVVCRTRKDAEHALKLIRTVLEKLELKLNPKKTRLVSMWDGKAGFDFLGLHHRRLVAEGGTGQKYSTTHQFPSKRSEKKMKESVHEVLAKRRALCMDMKTLIEELNPKIRGWRNHYGKKTAEKWMNKLDWYIILRFTIWRNKKRQKRKHLSGINEIREKIYKLGLLTLTGKRMLQEEECRKAV